MGRSSPPLPPNLTLTIDGDERGLTATMFDPPNGAFLVARRGHAAGTPLGGVGVRTIHPGAGQVRRLWVDPAARGQGVPGPS